jgi:hypothetical protein
VFFDLMADISAQNSAMPGQTRLRIDAPALCPMNPLQQADDLFQGFASEQFVPVKVAVELQQKQILFRLAAASRSGR